MKNMIRSTVASLVLAATCMAYGAVPSLNVTVSDASGKAAFKGTTNSQGTFSTSKLKPGNYVVQFNSPGSGIKGSYTIVVSAGTKKVSANGIGGERFAKGGVALKVDVGNGLNIAGQVAAETAGASKNGKKMVWIPPQAGSHMPGHYAEEGSPDAVAAKTSGNLDSQGVNNLQERGH